jgi:hypothetical protein
MEASHVAIVGDKVYCSTLGGLFYFNKSDNSVNKFSRENGLSDTRINALLSIPGKTHSLLLMKALKSIL